MVKKKSLLKKLINWTKREKYWFSKRIVKLIVTIIVYILIGDWLVDFVTALTQNGLLNNISANIIVFGTIGTVIWTVMDILDKKK